MSVILRTCISRWLSFLSLVVAGCLCICDPAAGQSCGPGWLLDADTNAGLTHNGGRAYTLTTWDPDGSGSQPPVLVAGGSFDGFVATWNGANWAPLGTLFLPPSQSNGGVMALAVDPGTGNLYAGGFFSLTSTSSQVNIARWTGTAWTAVGSGVSISSSPGTGDNDGRPYGVRSIAFLPNGNMVVGGLFDQAGSVSTSSIARWNGSGWNSMSSGMMAGSDVGEVDALAVLSNGKLVAGGFFDTAGGNQARNLAVWNSTSTSAGSAWAEFAGGVTAGGGGSNNTAVFALLKLASGDLAVAGQFDTVDNGTVTLSPSSIGIVTSPTSTSRSWQSVGAGATANDEFVSLQQLSNGDLIAAVGFGISFAGGGGTTGVARFHVSTGGSDPIPDGWSAFGDGLGNTSGPEETVYDTELLANGDLVAAGTLSNSGSMSISSVAVWNGLRPIPPATPSWKELRHLPSDDFDSQVNAFVVLGDGSLVAGGSFTRAGTNTSANHIARWNGSEWLSLGSGTSDVVNSLALVPAAVSGMSYLVAGGSFDTAGGVTVHNVALWDGNSWHAMNTHATLVGMDGPVYALTYDAANGYLLAGGSFSHSGSHGVLNIAMWDGNPATPESGDWPNPSGLTGLDSTVFALAPYNGMIAAGGSFSHADGSSIGFGVAVLDYMGSGSWSALNSGVNSTVRALAVRSGHLIVGGDFTAAGPSGSPTANTSGIAEWTGSAWASVGGGLHTSGGAFGNAHAVRVRSSGNLLYVGGFFSAVGASGATSASNIASWNGSSWSALTSGVNSTVEALAVMGNELEVGGSFSLAGGKQVADFARWSSDGVVRIVTQPNSGNMPCGGLGGSVTISVIAASDYDFATPLSYVWTHIVTVVADGTGGASTGGGTVSGASTGLLTISNFHSSDSGTYSVTITNTCGSVTSSMFTLGVTCPADINGSCNVSVQDIFDFLIAYFKGCVVFQGVLQPSDCLYSADFNQNGSVSVQDIFDFLTAYFAGCN